MENLGGSRRTSELPCQPYGGRRIHQKLRQGQGLQSCFVKINKGIGNLARACFALIYMKSDGSLGKIRTGACSVHHCGGGQWNPRYPQMQARCVCYCRSPSLYPYAFVQLLDRVNAGRFSDHAHEVPRFQRVRSNVRVRGDTIACASAVARDCSSGTVPHRDFAKKYISSVPSTCL